MPDIIKETNDLLQAHFDKVLLLTVSRFKERQEKVKQRLQGISYEFFYGADKNELTEEFIGKHYHYDKKNTLAPGYYFKPLNRGEIACSLSHRMIYQAMVDHNWQKVLVLEDDVVPDHEKLAQLGNCLEELPEDWELFYLGYLKNDKPTGGQKRKQAWYKIMAALGLSKISLRMVGNMLPKDYSTHLWKAGFHDCTHAYAVSLSGAKKLLAAQTPVRHRADNLLTALVLKGELKAFAARAFLFNQEIFTNTADRSFVRESPKMSAT